MSHHFNYKPARIKKSRLLFSLFLLTTFRESTVVVCMASVMCFHSCVLLFISIIARENYFFVHHLTARVIVTFDIFILLTVSSLQMCKLLSAQIIHHATEPFKLAQHVVFLNAETVLLINSSPNFGQLT